MSVRDPWIFGYGSLVWRPAFPFTDRRPAWVADWSRRFWQGSIDHRGVPEAPGRVVTVTPAPGSRCWGMAYRVPGERASEILAWLDYREKGGYQRCEVALCFDNGEQPGEGRGETSRRGLMYVATPRNPNYLGPATMAAIAEQVRRSRGPSGSNPEYVLRLAAALRAMGADDPHVFELEALLLTARDDVAGSEASLARSEP